MKKINKIVLSVCCIAVATVLFFVSQQRNASRVIISDNVEALSEGGDRFITLGTGVYVDTQTGCMCFDNKINHSDGSPGCTAGGGVCQLWTTQPTSAKAVLKAFFESDFASIAATLLAKFIFK